MKTKRKKDKGKNKKQKQLRLELEGNEPKKKNKRIRPKKVVSKYRAIVRDWGLKDEEHSEIELNKFSNIEFHVDGTIFRVSINNRNKCLQFDTFEDHLFLQPITTKCFLVKGVTHKK